MARYMTATWSGIFGGLSFYRGLQVLERESAAEKPIGYALTTVGFLRLMDTGYHLFARTTGELNYLTFTKENPGAIRSRALLYEAYKSAYRWRLFRIIAISMTSALYFALFATGKEIYSGMVWSGLTVAGIAVYKILYPSPSEEAWAQVNTNRPQAGKELPEVSFFVGNKSLALALTFRY